MYPTNVSVLAAINDTIIIRSSIFRGGHATLSMKMAGGGKFKEVILIHAFGNQENKYS